MKMENEKHEELKYKIYRFKDGTFSYRINDFGFPLKNSETIKTWKKESTVKKIVEKLNKKVK